MSEQSVQIGDEMVSLSDLAGISMDEFQEVRGFGLPRGVFHFMIKSGKLLSLGDANKPAAQFECEVQKVLELAEPDGVDVNTLVSKVHNETFFITDPAEDIGRIKAFLADVGAIAANVSLEDALTNAVGCQFVGQIMRIKDKKDPDREYINLKRDKLRAVGAEAA